MPKGWFGGLTNGEIVIELNCKESLMTKKIKEFDKLESIGRRFDQTFEEMQQAGETKREKTSRHTNDDMDMILVSKFYLRDGEKFAIKRMRDYRNNFGFVSYEFMTKYAGRECFCKVYADQRKYDGKFVMQYDAALLYRGKRKELTIIGGDMDILSDDEREILFNIEKCKDCASECDMLDKVEVASE